MESEKYDVFISYSRKDSEIVDIIEKELSDRDITCFVDRRAVGNGENYAGKITISIENSKIFLFVWTKNSNTSRNTQREVKLAADAEPKKTCIPFIIGKFEEDANLKYYLCDLNGIRIDEYEHKYVEQLVVNIAKQLGKDTDPHTRKFVNEQQKSSKSSLNLHIGTGLNIGLKVKNLFHKIFKSNKTPQSVISQDDKTIEEPISSIDTQVKYQYRNTKKDSKSLTDIDFIPYQKNGKYGFIDINGNELIPFKFEDAKSFSEGVASAKLDGKWGLIDRKGNSLSVFKFEDMSKFKDGMISAQLNGKWGVINKFGETLHKFRYDQPVEFIDDLAIVSKSSVWGCINKSGKPVIHFEYDHISPFINGFAIAKMSGLCEFYNVRGHCLLVEYLDDAKPFSEGMAAVKKYGNWGYINTEGHKVITFKYQEAGDFYNGRATVIKNGEEFEIDTRGNRVY